MSREKNGQENSPDSDYSFGYKEGVLDYLTYRALKSFEFVMPYLQPEMDVLECGSGPGVVTFKIAKKVHLGSVIGIDIEKDLIDSNNKKAKDSNVKNLKFEVASILELPYPNDSFDIVYMQALMVHMKDPNSAIKEVHRVLKKGGLALIREPIMDRATFSPEEPLLLEYFELIEKTIMSYGGDPSVGRKLWPILNETGFRDIFISLGWEQPETLQEWPDFYEGWINVLDGRIEDIVIENSWADEKRLDEIKKAYLNLGQNKTGYVGSPWAEVVATK